MRAAPILHECRRGQAPSASEALFLASVQGDDLNLLFETAAALRDQHKQRVITFSPKVFIPLTNLCRDFCGYCTFRRAPDEAGAKTMTLDEVVEVALRGQRLGCTEVLFSLGDKPESIYGAMRHFLDRVEARSTLDYLYRACRAVLEATMLLPHSNPGVMGRRHIARLREVNASMGLMLESASARLCLPSGPHANAPDKKPAVRLRTIAEAGKLSVPFTTGILIGIGETWAERVEALFAIRDLHRIYGHIQEVIIQNFRAKPTIPMAEHPEPALNEMLKTIALARIILGGAMNIQAPPNLSPAHYPLFLDAGINDWGGVSPLTRDYINPEAPWPALAVLRARTAAAGFTLKARLPLYPEYIAQGEKFIPPALLPYIERLRGQDYLVRSGGFYDRPVAQSVSL